MANIETGEVRRWDSLTKEQQESGKWIRIPDGTEGGSARARSLLDDLFPSSLKPDAREEILKALTKEARSFDATGKAK